MQSFPIQTLNGNCSIVLQSDGTQTREWDGDPRPEFPLSIDCKITDYCDAMCSYCHESSTMRGKHGDLCYAQDFLSVLPVGTELAIGGGDPLSHPDLDRFLGSVEAMGLVANITVNQGHLVRYHSRLKDLSSSGLINGVGISFRPEFGKMDIDGINNVVLHVIAGVHDIDEVVSSMQDMYNPKVLVLGYKVYGRGVGHFGLRTQKSLTDWSRRISLLFDVLGSTVSFDNLAISQLDVRRFFDEEQWGEMFLGGDGEFSMYIDFVTKTFSKSSTSNRIPIVSDLGECFRNVKEKVI